MNQPDVHSRLSALGACDGDALAHTKGHFDLEKCWKEYVDAARLLWFSSAVGVRHDLVLEAARRCLDLAAPHLNPKQLGHAMRCLARLETFPPESHITRALFQDLVDDTAHEASGTEKAYHTMLRRMADEVRAVIPFRDVEAGIVRLEKGRGTGRVLARAEHAPA